jgi:hypothetical protein
MEEPRAMSPSRGTKSHVPLQRNQEPCPPPEKPRADIPLERRL